MCVVHTLRAKCCSSHSVAAMPPHRLPLHHLHICFDAQQQQRQPACHVFAAPTTCKEHRLRLCLLSFVVVEAFSPDQRVVPALMHTVRYTVVAGQPVLVLEDCRSRRRRQQEEGWLGCTVRSEVCISTRCIAGMHVCLCALQTGLRGCVWCKRACVAQLLLGGRLAGSVPAELAKLVEQRAGFFAAAACLLKKVCAGLPRCVWTFGGGVAGLC